MNTAGVEMFLSRIFPVLRIMKKHMSATGIFMADILWLLIPADHIHSWL